MEARADQEGLRGGALSTLEAMIVSMGFMAPSVAMFFNTPFIAQFAGAAMPLAMLLSFAAVFLVALGFSQLARRTASAGSVYAFVSNAINPRTGFMGMWLFIIGYGIFEAATYSIFAAFSEAGVDEPDTAQEDVRRREDRGAAQSKETTE